MVKKVIVQVGNATKLHYAVQFVNKRGFTITSLGCGAKSIRGLRAVEISADSGRFDYCERCLEKESRQITERKSNV